MRYLALVFLLLGCSPSPGRQLDVGPARMPIGADGAPTDAALPAIAFSLDVTPGAVSPGGEGLRCLDITTPNDAPIYVSGWVTHKLVTHHVNVWFRKPGTSPIWTAVKENCQGGWGVGRFIFDDSDSGGLNVDFDSIGAIEIPAHADLIFDMHYLNTTTESADELVHVDFRQATRNSPLVYGVNIIAGKSAPPVPAGATRTTGFEELSPDSDEHIVALIGHCHAHCTDETFSIGEKRYYENTEWSEPPMTWISLDVPPKTPVRWGCTVVNTTALALPYGRSEVNTAEMCSIFGLTLGAQWERGAQEFTIGDVGE